VAVLVEGAVIAATFDLGGPSPRWQLWQRSPAPTDVSTHCLTR
jgi:hypothetical protein